MSFPLLGKGCQGWKEGEMEAPSPLLRKRWGPARRGSQVVCSWQLLVSAMTQMRGRTIKSALHDLLCIYISVLDQSGFNKDFSKTSLFNHFIFSTCLVSLSPAPVNTLAHPGFKRKISSAELSQIPPRAAFSPMCPRQSCQLLCSSDKMAAFHSKRDALLERGCKILWNCSRWIMLYHKYKMNIGLRFLKY